MSEFTGKQQKEINKAKRVLAQGETILDVTTGIGTVRRMGQQQKRYGVLLVTDRRVIFFTKKLGGYEMSDHVYGLLTSVDYKKGMIKGNLNLSASGDHYHISQIPKNDVERLAQRIRAQMAAVRSHSAPAPNSDSDKSGIPEQIKKLAILHKQGVLTDSEFTAKKADLLSRL
ncbi:MAG TPA: PH domain-containing protein [Candidatus Saccharimonadales bacterium]|nr:PH domain-containing protein [Candidatus Saccharimonadales bacterium]